MNNHARALARWAALGAATLSWAVPAASDTTTASASPAPYERVWLGARDIRVGDRGADAKTLNWALRAERLPAPYHGTYLFQSASAVRGLQAQSGLAATGVAGAPTRAALAERLSQQRATWYGPGLWGRTTACGVRLSRRTIGVAHRSLPCGTRVVFHAGDRWLRARVIDRGPYTAGFQWDLTKRLARQLGVVSAGVATLGVGVAP